MSKALAEIYIRNAMKLLAKERRTARAINDAYVGLNKRLLKAEQVEGGFAESFLSNPFVKTALSLLEKFMGNYKIRQALKLLKEAGEEASK